MEKHFSVLCLTSLILAGCAMPFQGANDLQGTDPNEYYAQHPIQNKVETRQISEIVNFMPGQAALSDDEEYKLRDGLRTISPLAVDSITIRLSKNDKFDLARENALAKLLGHMGYSKKVRFEPLASVKRGTAWVDISYLVVVAPDCPDWRMSPITSYSNTWQGNSRCAQEVNLGLMVADPHDLVHGTGDTGIMSTQRDSKALQDYHEGKDFMPNTLNAGNTGNSSGGSGSSGSGGGSGSSGNLSGSGSSAVASGTAGLVGSSQ